MVDDPTIKNQSKSVKKQGEIPQKPAPAVSKNTSTSVEASSQVSTKKPPVMTKNQTSADAAKKDIAASSKKAPEAPPAKRESAKKSAPDSPVPKREVAPKVKRRKRNILVIKYGDLGDFAFSFGAFKAIRATYEHDNLILLTSRRYANMAHISGLFDEIWRDELSLDFSSKDILDVKKLWKLSRRIKKKGFSKIFDLQHCAKSKWIFKLLGRRKPDWSGNISWARFPYMPKGVEHIVERHQQQLALAGVRRAGVPEIDWLHADISHFGLDNVHYALVVLAGDYTDPASVWDDFGFADVAEYLFNEGIIPVYIGAASEERMVNDVIKISSNIQAFNLVGKTNFGHLAELGRNAYFAIGADSGVMDLLSLTGCPTVYLMSDSASPYSSGTFGMESIAVQMYDLQFLKSEDVIGQVAGILDLYTQVENAQKQAEQEAIHEEERMALEAKIKENQEKHAKMQETEES